MAPAAPRKYRTLGTTDTAPGNGCECCGRSDLKVYIVLEPLEGGPLVYMGTTCGAKAERITVKELKAEITAAQAAARRAAQIARAAADEADTAAFAAWVLDTYGVTMTQPSDLWGAVAGETPFTLRLKWRAA